MPASVTMVQTGTDEEQTYRAKYSGEKFPLVLHATRRSGDPLDMSDADLALELTSDGNGEIVKEPSDFTCPYDGDDSQCSVVIDQDDTDTPGTYIGQLTIETDSEVIKGDPLTLVVMGGDEALTLGDIRQSLRDLESEYDYLKEQEFSNDLLAKARSDAIDDWNGMPGRQPQYTVRDFPSKWVSNWRKGAKAHALLMKARQLGGDTVSMSAGGVEFDDKGQRTQLYLKLGQSFKQEWIRFINTQQYQETLRRSFVSLS